MLLNVGALFAQQSTGHALEAVHEVGDGDLGRVLDQQMHVIVLAVHLDQLRLEVGAGLGEDDAQPVDGIAVEHPATILRHKDQMHMHLEDA